LDTSGKFATVVVDSNHNHDVVVALSALLHHRLGAITSKERLQVSSLS